MPGVKAPKLAGAPSVSDSVAGTVPPTEAGVQSETFATSPLSTITLLVESTVPFGAVQLIVQLSGRNPRGPMISCVASKAGVGRTDGLTSIVNAPVAGTTIEDSRCVGIACGGDGGGVVAGGMAFRIVAVYRLKSFVT